MMNQEGVHGGPGPSGIAVMAIEDDWRVGRLVEVAWQI